MTYNDLLKVPYATSCEWTVSLKPHSMCGKNPLSKKSYCEEHYKRAYVTPTDKNIEEYIENDVKDRIIVDADDLI